VPKTTRGTRTYNSKAIQQQSKSSGKYGVRKIAVSPSFVKELKRVIKANKDRFDALPLSKRFTTRGDPKFGFEISKDQYDNLIKQMKTKSKAWATGKTDNQMYVSMSRCLHVCVD
jgi:hypothetical protein